jgi:hypothetical protein
MIVREQGEPSDGVQLTIMPTVVGIIDRLLTLGTSGCIGGVLWVHGSVQSSAAMYFERHAHLILVR